MTRMSCVLRVLGLAAAMTLLLGACDWTTFHYGPERTGYNPTETAIGVSNVANLVQAWSASTGGSVSSSPAVANGRVFVGSEDTKLYAFDAAGNTNCSGAPKTCAPVWTANTGNSVVRSSPTVSNGVVYVGSAGLVDHKLFAFDAAGNTHCSGTPKTCAPLWTAPLSDQVVASPAVANGRVFIGAGDGTFYAFDTLGNTLWTATAGRQGFGIYSSPAVANGVVYVPSNDGHLYAFDAAGNTNCSGTTRTCNPLWTADLYAAAPTSPAVSNGVVYIANGNGVVFAFDAAGTTNCAGDPKTCTPIWTGAIPSSIHSSPAVANGVVYIGSSSNLYTFDAAGVTNCSGSPEITCEPLWSGSGTGGISSSPAVANGVVYFGSWDHNIYAVDAAGNVNCSGLPKRCDPLWSASTGDQVVSSPAVANGRVYVGSNDHHLYAYSLP